MAPLLAIASWFILTTTGVYDKYVVATVSFAIGLITENIVNRLISFFRISFQREMTILPLVYQIICRVIDEDKEKKGYLWQQYTKKVNDVSVTNLYFLQNSIKSENTLIVKDIIVKDL